MEEIINQFQNVTLSRFLIFLFSIVLTLFISGAIANLTKNILNKYFKRTLVKLVSNIVLYTCYFIGFSIILTKIINFNLPAFLAALGVLGAFIFVPTIPVLQNAIAGIVIAFSRPIKVGNYIDAGGELVLVDDIRLIKTRTISLNGKIIFIPNIALITGNIINYSSGKFEKVVLNMEVGNSAELSEIKKIILQTCKEGKYIFPLEKKIKKNIINQYFEDDEILNDLNPKCFVKSISKEKYVLEVNFWIADFPRKNEIINDIWMTLKNEFAKKAIEFA